MTRRILLVTDEGEKDRELKRALGKCSAVCEIESAATRRQLAALPRPDLILLDLMLSSEPAPGLLRWLRTEPVYRDIPVFVLGSEVLRRDIAEAYELGANSCFLMEPARPHFEPIAEGIATYASLLPGSAYGAC